MAAVVGEKRPHGKLDQADDQSDQSKRAKLSKDALIESSQLQVQESQLLPSWSCAASQHMGKKAYQQDFWTSTLDLAEAFKVRPESPNKFPGGLEALQQLGPVAFFGVYDGHGSDFCSQWLQRRFPEFLARAMDAGLREAGFFQPDEVEEETKEEDQVSAVAAVKFSGNTNSGPGPVTPGFSAVPG